jgi:hypothetical protein
MASTSVHLPASIVEQLDRLAAERGMSRNRVILEACMDLLAHHRGRWPAGFFDADLGPEELRALQSGGTALEEEILRSRRERPVPPL